MKKLINDPKIIALACITLGLAPYAPEPHIWGKLKWISGGANGMMPMDIFDTILHGLPWLLALGLVAIHSYRTIKR